MTKKKEGHTGFRNGDLFCYNCGGSVKIPLPMPVGIAADLMKSFDKHHKNCSKTWTEPIPEPNDNSEEDNANWWFLNGERGLSSMAIYTRMTGRIIEDGRTTCHPSDPDDFRRCYLLLQAVPQWKEKMYLMKPVSKVWSSLVDNWDKLTEMFEACLKSKDGKATDMYALMKEIGC